MQDRCLYKNYEPVRRQRRFCWIIPKGLNKSERSLLRTKHIKHGTPNNFDFKSGRINFHCPHHKTSTRIPYQISRVSRPGQMCPSWPVALLAQAQLGPVAVASAVDPSCKVHIHDRRGSTLANLQQIRELQGTAGN